MEKKVYDSGMTREQFCFFETRTVARLMCEGKNAEEIIAQVAAENLFQYPTERTIKRVARACCRRMAALNNMDLVRAIAYGSSEPAKQICLYAMMKQYPLMWDFMVKLVGEKYRNFDMSFGKLDLNMFFDDLKRSCEEVAGWSDSTVEKLKQVLRKVLIENEYLDDLKADHLNPVLLESCLETAIRESGDLDALPAFNCLA